MYNSILTLLLIAGYRKRNMEDVRFTMGNWLEQRRNYAAYSVFYTIFMPSIVGKRRFANRVRNLPDGQEIATVSDEALAMLGLENSIERWDDLFDKSGGQYRIIHKDEEYPKEWISDKYTKYTGTSSRDPNIPQDTEDKRWSQKGIERFNELRKHVIADRATHNKFMATWLKQERDKRKNRKAEELDEDDSTGLVDADDDLFHQPSQPSTLTPARNKVGVESSSDEDENDDSFGQ
jgi:hypothetical protein